MVKDNTAFIARHQVRTGCLCSKDPYSPKAFREEFLKYEGEGHALRSACAKFSEWLMVRCHGDILRIFNCQLSGFQSVWVLCACGQRFLTGKILVSVLKQS